METFAYIDGQFWDRVSNTPEEVAQSLGARVVSQEEFVHGVCGPSIRCELRLKDIPTPFEMTAQIVARKLQIILNRMVTNPEQGGCLVSPALKEAVQEAIAVALTGDWGRLAALLRVKSYVCGVQGLPPNEFEEPFWEDTSRFGDDQPTVYSLLDGLQFRAAMRAEVIPSGITVYGVLVGGTLTRDEAPPHPVEDASPTIRLMRECDARYTRSGDDRQTDGDDV